MKLTVYTCLYLIILVYTCLYLFILLFGVNFNELIEYII